VAEPEKKKTDKKEKKKQTTPNKDAPQNKFRGGKTPSENTTDWARTFTKGILHARGKISPRPGGGVKECSVGGVERGRIRQNLKKQKSFQEEKCNAALLKQSKRDATPLRGKGGGPRGS